MKILLAEDDWQTIQSIELLMDTWRYELEVVQNGKDAVERVGKCPYDLVLMDKQMPVMGGYEAIQRIRGLNLPWYQPILVLSASAALEECVQIGADDLLEKPYDCDALQEKIYSLTSKVICIGIQNGKLTAEEKMPEDRTQFLKLKMLRRQGYGFIKLLGVGSVEVSPEVMQLVSDNFTQAKIISQFQIERKQRKATRLNLDESSGPSDCHPGRETHWAHSPNNNHPE